MPHHEFKFISASAPQDMETKALGRPFAFVQKTLSEHTHASRISSLEELGISMYSSRAEKQPSRLEVTLHSG